MLNLLNEGDILMNKKQKFEIEKCPNCHVDSTFRIIKNNKQCMCCGKIFCNEEKQEIDFFDVT